MNKDRVGQQRELPNLAGGRGISLFYQFFEDQLEPGTMLGDIAIEPGAYAGHHRHEGHQSILYMLSGRAESYQGGERCILEPGDAMLSKPGQAHAIRNIGDVDLRLLEFNAAVAGKKRDHTLLPLPEAISDWK